MDGAESVPLPEPDSVPLPDPPPGPQTLDLTSTLHHLVAAVASQEDTMQRHEQALTQWNVMMSTHAEMLDKILQTLHSSATAPPAPSQPVFPQPSPAAPSLVPSREPRLPAPERYGGDAKECRGFLTQCRLAFDLQPGAYPTDHSQVAYVLTLLTDRAWAWAAAQFAALFSHFLQR